MPRLHIFVSRHSAFYSPLIATIAGGFLQREGLDADYSVLAKGATSRDLIRSGRAHVIQSAVSSSWPLLEKGLDEVPVHFAQINRRDGFFLIARERISDFNWKMLEGRVLIADHAGQPFAMIRYAAHCKQVDWPAIKLVDAGTVEQMEAAFRSGAGDYVHLQGPAAQQLEHDGAGVIVASVGEAMPPVAFSSLTASRDFLSTETARAFTRAFREAKAWTTEAPSEEIAAAEAAFFPTIARPALVAAIERYQRLGCWNGGIEIPRDLYEQALEVFRLSNAVSKRHPYEQVVTTPPM